MEFSDFCWETQTFADLYSTVKFWRFSEIINSEIYCLFYYCKILINLNYWNFSESVNAEIHCLSYYSKINWSAFRDVNETLPSLMGATKETVWLKYWIYFEDFIDQEKESKSISFIPMKVLQSGLSSNIKSY